MDGLGELYSFALVLFNAFVAVVQAPRSRLLSVRIGSLKKLSTTSSPAAHACEEDMLEKDPASQCSPSPCASSTPSGDDDGDPSFDPTWEGSFLPMPVATRRRTVRSSQQGSEGLDHPDEAHKELAGACRRARTDVRRAFDSERRKKKKKITRELDGKVRTETEAENRGQPPEPIRDFRVSAELVGDVLMIWELLMVGAAICHFFMLLWNSHIVDSNWPQSLGMIL